MTPLLYDSAPVQPNTTSASLPQAVLPALEYCEHRIEHMIEAPGNIAREVSQDKITVLLKQRVFMPVAPVTIRISQMLVSIEFHNYPQLRAQEIHFHVPGAIEGDRQSDVKTKMVLGRGKGL